MVTIPKKQAVLALAISSALALSACGGSDDSGTSGGGNIGGGGGTVQPGGVIITAMDGYLKNALLCADDNGNGICEASEVIKDSDGNVLLTDESGHIDAEINQADEKRLETSARLIATVQSLDADSEIITEDMDLPGQAMKAVTFRAPAGSEIASPITDLVVSKMQSTDTAEGLSKEDAEKAVIESLGGLNTEGELSQDILYSDYIVAKETGDDASKELAAKIHKTAQILTETKANASSDEAFDAQLDQVVEATVDATATMKPEELEDETYKPYVPVVEEPTEPPVIVTNFAVTFNAENIKAITAQFTENGAFYGDTEKWLDYSVQIADVQVLVNDSDATTLGKQNTVIIANTKALEEKNIAVSLKDGELAISRSDSSKDVAAGTYSIQLASNDLNSKGEALSSFVTSATTVDFVVKNFNYAPVVNTAKLDQVQKAFDAMKLEVGVPANKTFNIEGLFTDKNGEYDITSVGQSYQANGIEYMLGEGDFSQLIATGTPETAMDATILTVFAFDKGGLKAEAEITIPKVTSVTPSEIKDVLVGSGKTWYRWNGEQDYNEAEQTTYNYANCMAFRFVESSDPNSGTVLFAEGEQCPQESDVTKQDGTWEINESGHLIWSLPGEGNLTLTRVLTQHENDAREPRVTAFELEQKTALTRESNGYVAIKTNSFESGFTLFKGQVSANTYWNDASGSIWVNGKDVAIDLSAQHGQFTANELFDYIDVDLYFNGMQCSELGLVANEHGTFEPTFPGSRYDWFRITGEALNGNAFYFNASDKGFKAFQSGNDCAVNLDITEAMATSAGANFKAGQALTVYGSEASNIGDEEFIINTFIDRDFSIQPKEDLIISETGFFFVDGNSVSNVYRTEKGGKTVFLEQGMELQNGKWSDWSPFGDSQLITQYVATNGHHAYQFFNEGDHYNSDESFTIWSDAVNTMHGKDTGSDEVWDQKIFFSLEEAQAAVEAVLNSEINFVGTTWRETFVTEGSENREHADMTFSVEGVNYQASQEDPEFPNGFYSWADYTGGEPVDLPCLYNDDHTCNYQELNAHYDYEEGVRWEWDPLTDKNKMWRHKGRHESVWTLVK
ncbi:hypothetical protein [Enterovibrio norvegicus]|uniref:hypothetical protein n=1 Tax=Enterovibrio norvegicus TaxID=188144 RepID=UPI0035531AA0